MKESEGSLAIAWLLNSRKKTHWACSIAESTQIIPSSKSCQAPGSPQFPATTSFRYKKKVPNHVMFTPAICHTSNRGLIALNGPAPKQRKTR